MSTDHDSAATDAEATSDNAPAGPLGRVIEAAEKQLDSLEADATSVPELEASADELAAAIEAVKDDPTTEIEQALYEDIDAIGTISKHALIELETGDLDALEGSLEAIRDRAAEWEDDQ